ncbi:MAG: hypothetical protein NCW75_03190 [Phycisphaera sp.]|nr:MAG: hypothetical protein NCW75_03190 [Phycisphaera sp.]
MSEHLPSDGEFNEFLLGPKDNDDGSTPSDPDEIRRLKAIAYHAQKRMRELGLDGEPAEHPPEPTVPTTRARDIREIADKAMSDADDRVRTRIEHIKIKSPDGWQVSRLSVHAGALDDLTAAVKDLAGSAVGTLVASIRGTAKVCIRFGGWFKADATATAGQPADEGAAADETAGQ